MLQWWHLMVLQYVAANLHLPSVSPDNIATIQYTKPYSRMKYQQSQLLWYRRCCFLSPTSWQPLFIAIAVSFFNVSSSLPTYINHITPFTTTRVEIVVVVVTVAAVAAALAGLMVVEFVSLMLLNTISNLFLKILSKFWSINWINFMLTMSSYKMLSEKSGDCLKNMLMTLVPFVTALAINTNFFSSLQ